MISEDDSDYTVTEESIDSQKLLTFHYLVIMVVFLSMFRPQRLTGYGLSTKQIADVKEAR